MKKKIIIGVIALVILGGAGIMIFKNYLDNTKAETEVVIQETTVKNSEETDKGYVINNFDHIHGVYLSEETKPITSELMFSVDGMTGTTGKFNKFEIQIEFDSTGQDQITVVIDAASIYTASDLRDEHLRDKEEFFNVKKYPNIIFKSTEIIKGDTSYIAKGELEFLGKTNPIEIPFLYNGSKKDDENIEVFEGKFNFDRIQYGMSESSSIGNVVTLWFYTALRKKTN
jgi:polyisoprenoid-binding protein YceI